MMVSYISQKMEQLEQNGLKRCLKDVEQSQGARVVLDGREVLNFCSNNYLGLSNDPRLKQAAIQSMEREGFGSGASRLVCGNMQSHRLLEQRLTRFKGTEQCLLFSSGYMANVGIIAGLFGRDDVIFSDRLNHASIIDGIRLSQANMKRYPHCDTRALEDMLKTVRGFRRRVIITDSVFSMDGDIAPLDKIVALAKQYDCLVMVDEAHALGVLGQNGKGAVEHFGVTDQVDIHMGTLSKAAGSFGGYCCGSSELIDYLIHHARSFIYTTGMPPLVAAASIEAIDIIERDNNLRDRLWKNTRFVLTEVKRMGFETLNTQTPIIPIVVKDAEVSVAFCQALIKRGVFVNDIRPPTVPCDTARLRLTVMASHTRTDLERLIKILKEVGGALCLI